MKKGMFSSAIWGVQWSTISMVITSVLQILYTSIMARLLEPAAFGIMAIAQIILHFASFFSRLGMGRALVQKEKITVLDIRAVFTSSVLLSVSFWLLLWFSAPLASSFFKNSDSQLHDVIQVMSLSFLITGFSITAQSLIVRNCKFKTLSQIEITSFVVFFVVGTGLGYIGFGVWSLVYASLSQTFTSLLLTYFRVRHNILPLFNWKYHKPFYSYGAVFSLTNIVDFLGQNVVQILIGKFFGDYKLGIYRQANNILHMPLSKLSLSISNVFFPLMSKIQNDLKKLRKSYLTSMESMCNLLFPVCFGISAASDEVVLVLLGEKFVESAPILAILSIGMGFQFLIPYASVVLDATARLNKKFYVQLVYLLLLIAAIYLFRSYSLVTLALVVTIGIFLRNIIYSILVGNLLNLSFKDQFLSVWPGIFKGIMTYVVIFSLTWLMNRFGFPLALKVSLQILVGVIVMVYHLVVKPLPSFGRIWSDLIIKYPRVEDKLGYFLYFCNWYKNPKTI